MEPPAKKTGAGECDYLRVARTLRDKLDVLITSGATDHGTQRKVLSDLSQELDRVLANEEATHQSDEISVCTHSCSKHEQVLNPAVWKVLPRELLLRVFAKLPNPDICRLKILSNEWEQSLETSSSEFTLALKDSSPRMLARVTWGKESSFLLHFLDGTNNRWHESHVSVGDNPEQRRLVDPESVDWREHMSGGADGGLMCHVDKNKAGLDCIFVINPMTRVVKQLPTCDLLPSTSKPSMMRIFVDRDTFHYMVVVVSCDPLFGVAVYESKVQKWTRPKSSLGRIFGITYDWSQLRPRGGPCLYDSHNGRYFNFAQDREKWSRQEVISYDLMEDRLFVLYWDQAQGTALVSQYHVPENMTTWVRETTFRCFAWEYWGLHTNERTCKIRACGGSLFVFILASAGGYLMSLEFGYVYNLPKREWHKLPWLPWWSNRQLKCFKANGMCELHWSIQP